MGSETKGKSTDLDIPSIHFGSGRVTDDEDVPLAKYFSAFTPRVLFVDSVQACKFEVRMIKFNTPRVRG